MEDKRSEQNADAEEEQDASWPDSSAMYRVGQ